MFKFILNPSILLDLDLSCPWPYAPHPAAAMVTKCLASPDLCACALVKSEALWDG